MKKTILLRLFTALLSVVILLVSLPLNVFAEEISGEDEVYIKSIKLSTAENREDAKKELETAGYIFLDANLNDGTGEDGVYIGYTTTTDPNEAVYDLKLMNMKGGFTMTSMEKALEAHKTEFTQMARDLNLLIEEFAQAYKEGSPVAEKAYNSLNFFRVKNEAEGEAKESNGLGYQFVEGNMSISDLTEMILFCDSQILDSIISILTMGIQLRRDNWLGTLSAIGPYSSSEEYMEDEAELKRRAEQLLPILQLYATAYNSMEETGIVGGTFDENFEIVGTMAAPGAEVSAAESQIKNLEVEKHKFYKVVFDMLNGYPYGSIGSLKDFFSSLEDTTNEKLLYPLVSVMTDGEFVAMSYGCVFEVLLGAEAKLSDFENYDEIYNKATQEVKSLYIYGNVDAALMDNDTVVAFTDEANRHMAATGEMEFYEKETWGENAWETGKNVALIVGGAGMAFMALAKIAIGVTMVVTTTWTTTGLAALPGVCGVAMKFCALISNPYALLATVAIALTVVGISYVISAISEYYNGLIDWSDNPIPEFIYDVKEVGFTQLSENGGVEGDYLKTPTFIYYEVVRDLDGDPVDLNARSKDASQWLVMYASYDRPGEDSKPIKAEDLLLLRGDGQTPADYTPLCVFGEVIAKNLNSYDEEDKYNGLYFYYKQDKTVEVENSKKYYISDVYLQTGESPEHCMGLLAAAGYTPINVNLTPDSREEEWVGSGDKIYTYLGYKVTTNQSYAIRDIRLARDITASPYNYGGSTYAECGISANYTLYATKFTAAGTPILAGGLLITQNRGDAPAGYEPVNFFSGGPAVSINHVGTSTPFLEDGYYLYFLPSTTFTEGETYLSGLSYISATRKNILNMADTKKNDILTLLKEKTNLDYPFDTDDEKFVATSMYTVLCHGYENAIFDYDESLDTFMYGSTHNPYRALYALEITDEDGVPTELIVDGCGYVQTPTYQFLPFEYNGFGWDYEPSSLLNVHSSVEGAIVLDSKIFVTGNPSGNSYSATKNAMSKVQPIKLSDFAYISDIDDSEAEALEALAFTPVNDYFGSDDEPIWVNNAIDEDDYGVSVSYAFYLANTLEDERIYVSNILISDSIDIFRQYGGTEAGLSVSDIKRGMVLSALSSLGATHFCSNTVTMNGWDGNNTSASGKLDSFYFAYTKTDKASSGFTDMFLYYDGLTNEEPPEFLYRGLSKYNLICKINYNFTANADAIAPAVYLYATTDKDAGSRIIDFTVSSSPFKTGYETVRTMNGRSLIGEIVDSLKKEKKHNPLESARDTIDQWITFFEPTSQSMEPLHGYYYLHFKREGEPMEDQKPYISELFLTENGGNKKGALDDLFDQGAEGYVNKDLNAGTIGNDIYLGYSYTANIEDAITDIRAYHKKSPPSTKTDDDGIVYELVSKQDLNNTCGFWSDYIYLYTTKNANAGLPITAINSSSKKKSEKIYADEVNGVSLLINDVITMKKWDSSSASDLNEDAGGDYIYLLLTRKYNATDGSYVYADHGKDKIYTRKEINGASEGAYVAALYVMDKNTIRQEKLESGVDSGKCECSDITDEEVYARLEAMGATTILTTPILSEGSEYADGNKNEIFIGYSRTDTLRNAIKGLVINVELFSGDEPEEKIYVDNKSYSLVAEAASKVNELPHAINLLGLEDSDDISGVRMYLYTTTSGDTPFYDIAVNDKPIVNGWTTALSQNGKEVFLDVHEMAELAQKQVEDGGDLGGGFFSNDAQFDFISYELEKWMADLKDIFNPKNEKISSWYIHGKKYAGASPAEENPYIGELFIAKGGNKHEALVNLLSSELDGYLDTNLNKGTDGDHIYIGYKRVDNSTSKTRALTDIVIRQGDDPPKILWLTVGGVVTKYELVDKVNLNAGADGKALYLYTTQDTLANEPITDIRINVGSTIDVTEEDYIESTALRADGSSITSEKIDLNKNAGGDSLYLLIKRPNPNSNTYALASIFGSGSFSIVLAFVGLSSLALSFAILIKAQKIKKSKEN